MKISNKVKKVNIGINISLSNVELLVLDKEAQNVINSSTSLMEDMNSLDVIDPYRTVEVNASSLVNILNFINKYTQEIVSLENAYNDLFSPMTLDDEFTVFDTPTRKITGTTDLNDIPS